MVFSDIEQSIDVHNNDRHNADICVIFNIFMMCLLGTLALRFHVTNHFEIMDRDLFYSMEYLLFIMYPLGIYVFNHKGT